ncbi:hypothetical protein OH77DRAFT_1441188 [Trametes cingulata]|nr:hypothetical protein OH77DRAFT_1441188 [Trametes cingulata]
MHPRDLLNLARTSEAFRAFLMSRNSAPFWRAARQTVEGLPDCPPYLSEPEYANLMFFAHCHNCLTTNVHNIIFEFSVRYCRGCKNIIVLEYLAPHDEYVAMLQQSMDQNEDVLNLHIVVKDDVHRAYYHAWEWQDLQYGWEALRDDAEAKRRFLQDRAAAVRLVQESCDALYDWKEAQVQNRAQELEDIRTERINTILDFLMEEGWTEELQMMQPEDYTALAQQQWARRAVKLTRRGWANISGDVHAFMADVQHRRLWEVRRAVLHDRFSTFDQLLASYYAPDTPRTAIEDTDPKVVDFAMMPAFKEVFDAPHDGPLVLANDDPTTVRTLVGTWRREWKEARKAELVEKLVAAIPDLAGAEDPLNLAIAAFSCHCMPRGVPLRFPALLAHACTRDSPRRWAPDVYDATIAEYSDVTALSLSRIRVDSEMILRLRAIIRALGLDPLTATLEQLQRCEVRLRCRTCIYRPGDGVTHRIEAFDWLRALKHHDTPLHRNHNRTCSWRVLPAEVSSAVRSKETRERRRLEAERARATHDVRFRFGCGVCAHNCRGKYPMVYHLRTAHGLDVSESTIQIGIDAYLHLDNEPLMIPRIWLNCLEDGTYLIE